MSPLLKSSVSGGATTDYTPGVSSRVSSTKTYGYSGLKNIDEQSGSASRQYDAFGKLVSSSGNWVGPYGYGGAYGYQTDPDYGLKLLGHRYYDSESGTFLSRDPVKDGRNWYGYCDGNPVAFADRTGNGKHLVVDGDNGGLVGIGSIPYMGANAILHWFLGDEVHIIEPKTTIAFENQVWDADSLQLSFHGGDQGGGGFLGEGQITPRVVWNIVKRRQDAGLPPMDVINLDICYALMTVEAKEAWGALAHHVYGWSGECPIYGREEIHYGKWSSPRTPEEEPVRLATCGARRMANGNEFYE